MKATITKDYRCAPEGHTVRTFPAGTIVTGRVAEWALADEMATVLGEKKPAAKLETKPAAAVETMTDAMIDAPTNKAEQK
jgi:hypothetical protein